MALYSVVQHLAIKKFHCKLEALADAMASAQDAAAFAECPPLLATGSLPRRRHGGQSGTSSILLQQESLPKHLSSRLSPLHLAAKWLLRSGRGGLTGRNQRSSPFHERSLSAPPTRERLVRLQECASPSTKHLKHGGAPCCNSFVTVVRP